MRFSLILCFNLLGWNLAAIGMKTVSLAVIQPSTGPFCPGQEVILTCTVVQTEGTSDVFLSWNYVGLNMTAKITYDNSDPQSGPHILGTFITTAVFMTNTSTNSTMIASNATLTSAAFSNNNELLNCKSPPQKNVQTATIIVAGAEGRLYGLRITASASLTWLPSPNTNCTFNYTVNITNSSCSMTVYSSSTSLIPTDLLTHGQNYSFAVAVIDSTRQHGPWSEQLMVTWDVPGLVVNISWIKLNETALSTNWKPPPSPTHPPVLYYTVTHNVSCNGSELAFNTTINKAILNGASYGETYYISVCGINAIGKGKVTTITFSIASLAMTPINNCTGQCSNKISVAVLSSAVLSIIGTALITSLVWCCAVIKFRKKKDVNIDPHTVSAQQEMVLTPFQGNISIQENVAYGQV